MDLYTLSGIREILARHGFKFSKSLGQNFLADENICVKIAESAALDKDFGVLEIGAGIGALTYSLSRAAARVCAVEIDRALTPVLAETVGDMDNVKIVFADILKTDISALVETEFSGLRRAVCANLPYYITSPVLAKLIECNKFEIITVMLQKEVAERLCALPGSPDYGAFSVFIQYYTNPEIQFTVPSSCFVPQPKVDSAVIRMTVRESPPVNVKSENLFFKVVRASFAQRRKLLANGLYSAFNRDLDKKMISTLIENLGFPENVRGETLDLTGFSRIANGIYDILQSK
jgi:16S rRNA (adenine1518-N6/adenine1519-N6)-dimethyltransferase